MIRSSVPYAIAAILALSAPAWSAGEDVVMRAMEDELARSTEKLRMENLDRPYFIAYRIDETSTTDVGATFGSLVQNDDSRERQLTVEVRVGDPNLDNTNFLSSSGGGGSPFAFQGETSRLPLEDNYREIRRKIWLTTDAAYKEALESLSRKRATLQNKTRTEEIPDFSSAEPATTIGAPPEPLGDPAKMAGLVRNLSQLFRSMPQVSASSVRLTGRVVYSRYANSEGTRFKRTTPEARLVATAEGYAQDGLPLRDFVSAFARSFGELPSEAQLANEIRAMGERIAKLQQAQLLENYNGPVVFEGEAAGELLAQGFVPDLLASHKPVTDNPQYEMMMQQQESALTDKLGARVLPRFLDVEDDPTLVRHGSTTLLGGYTVDDDGLPTRKNTVVAQGILKTLLATRNPARGASASTGNRRGAGAAPSNLVITAKDGMSEESLRKELLRLVQEQGLEFGIVVRRIGDPLLSPSGSRSMQAMMAMMGGGGEKKKMESCIAAYKVYPDGREELLRNLEIGDISASSFKDIVAASASQAVVTLPFRSGGGPVFDRRSFSFGQRGAGAPLITVVTPALLFEELTCKKPSGEVPNPPIAQHPFFAK